MHGYISDDTVPIPGTEMGRSCDGDTNLIGDGKRGLAPVSAASFEATSHDQDPPRASKRAGQRLRKVVVEQALRLQRRRGVSRRFVQQVNALALAQRLAAKQRVLQRIAGRAVSLLKAIHARHLRYAHRLVADASALRANGLDYGQQARPRHDALHHGEELLAPHALLLHRLLGAGTAPLAPGVVAVKFTSRTHACAASWSTKRSVFP
jgi:hypothetical protein